jgi:uncharacterized spore protein YtfJ
MSKDKQPKDKKRAAPAPAPAPPPVDRGRMGFGLTRAANALGGARLCYGDPIEVGERVVIPVARVRGAGGYGFGRGSSRAADGSDTGDGDGGGGGGALEATPAGFLDITPDGVRYEAIPDPVTTARAIGTGASALAMLVSAVVGLRRLSRGRRSAGLLPPSR